MAMDDHFGGEVNEFPEDSHIENADDEI